MTTELSEFTNDMLQRVLQYGFDHGVGFELTDHLDPYTPSASNPETGWIMINMNWHEPQQLPLHAAHEIEHVLHQDPKELYFFSNAKTRIEGEANRDALNILVPIYFADIDEDEANLDQFMEALDIPPYMEDAARSTIEQFYL